jgi:hypothetical protein
MLEMTGFPQPTEVGRSSSATTYFGIEALTRSKVGKWKVNMQTIQERLFLLQDNEAVLLYRVIGRLKWQGALSHEALKADEQEEKDSHSQTESRAS